MNSQTRAVPAMIGLIFTVSVLVFPIRVEASEEGRRNTALGLGAAAAYLLLTKRDKVPGLVAAGAAAYAYKRYDDAFREKTASVTGDTGTAMIGTTEMVAMTMIATIGVAAIEAIVLSRALQ